MKKVVVKVFHFNECFGRMGIYDAYATAFDQDGKAYLAVEGVSDIDDAESSNYGRAVFRFKDLSAPPPFYTQFKEFPWEEWVVGKAFYGGGGNFGVCTGEIVLYFSNDGSATIHPPFIKTIFDSIDI